MAEQAVASAGKPRGRPFSRDNQPARGPRPDALAEQDFGQLARKILVDPRAQRALMARARRGDLPAHVIKMLVENAAPAPEPVRTAPTTGEVAAWMAASVPPFVQLLMYDHARGLLDDAGHPTGARKARARVKAAKKAEPPAEEPDLAEDQPLRAASERLRAQGAEDRSVAVVPDLSRVPDPEPSRAELLAMGRAPVELHDWRDVAHRVACRACRRTWKSDGADPTQIRR